MVPVIADTADGKRALYYQCRICGYRVKATYAQDKDLLDEDNKKIIYFGYACATFFSALVVAQKYIGGCDLVRAVMEGMASVRSTRGYEYCDSFGFCLPENDIFVSEPEKEKANSIKLYGKEEKVSGTVLDALEISETLTEAILVIFSPEADFIFALQGLAELVAEPSKLQDKGFSYLLQLIAKGADNDAVDLILSLIDVGIDVTDDGNINDYINVGDYSVHFVYSYNQHTYHCQAVFDKETKRVKVIVYDYPH